MPNLVLVKDKFEMNEPNLILEGITFHPKYLDAIFKFKNKLCERFDDIRGILDLDHMSINIIDPAKRLLIFSTTSSVEYNLISQGHWIFDKSFSLNFQKDKKIYSWQNAYENSHAEQLKLIKESNHGFKYGFNMPIKMGDFQIIFSYATRQKRNDYNEFYLLYFEQLIKISHFAFESIQKVLIKDFNCLNARLSDSEVPKLFIIS